MERKVNINLIGKKMGKIRSYNPSLGIRLSDLKVLTTLSNSQIRTILECVCKSVEQDTTYTMGYYQNQYLYDNIMRNIQPNIESYDRYLIEKLGHTRQEIDEYHTMKYIESE